MCFPRWLTSSARPLTFLHTAQPRRCIPLSTNSLRALSAPFAGLRRHFFKRDSTAVLLKEPDPQWG